jgi:hypothetical protein
VCRLQILNTTLNKKFHNSREEEEEEEEENEKDSPKYAGKIFFI